MQTREILRIKGGGALYTVTAGATLAEAVGVLVDHDIGSLVVMERGALVGMLTFSQVLRVIKQSGAAGLESSVAAVMEGQPLSVGPDLDMDGLQRLMLERRESDERQSGSAGAKSERSPLRATLRPPARSPRADRPYSCPNRARRCLVTALATPSQ